MKSVIVTGANGFIGRNLVEALTAQDYKVYALSRHFDKTLKDNDRVSCIDVTGIEVSDINKKLQNLEFDFMVHLAWEGTSGPQRADFNVQLDNVRLTCEYVKLCKEIGCKRFIYASSINEMETYEYLQSDNITPGGGYIYGTGKMAAHLMGETVAYANEIEFIPVIITNIYGAGEKSARMIYTAVNKLIHKEHCSFTAGYQTYDFIYITDAINSIIAVAQKGKAFNRYYIGSGNPKPLREFLIKMRDIVDPEAEIGLGDLQFRGKDINYSQFEMDKIKKDTGYENQISFDEGIRLTEEYIRGEEQ